MEKFTELYNYIGNEDQGQAWDDYFCLHAIEILARFSPCDWQHLTKTWQSCSRNFKDCFLSIITEIKPSDYKYAVPLVLHEFRTDEQVSLMATVRHFLNSVPKEDPVWRVQSALITDLNKTRQTLAYRAKFVEEVLARISAEK